MSGSLYVSGIYVGYWTTPNMKPCQGGLICNTAGDRNGMTGTCQPPGSQGVGIVVSDSALCQFPLNPVYSGYTYTCTDWTTIPCVWYYDCNPPLYTDGVNSAYQGDNHNYDDYTFGGTLTTPSSWAYSNWFETVTECNSGYCKYIGPNCASQYNSYWSSQYSIPPNNLSPQSSVTYGDNGCAFAKCLLGPATTSGFNLCNTAPPPSTGLSTAAKIAIGVMVGLFGIGAIAGGVFFMMKKQGGGGSGPSTSEMK